LKLSEAKAQKVWEIFAEMCKVPRQSRHEEKICEWAREFAKANGFESREDGTGNIVIEVPATKGYEGRETVVVQGHLDMVCEKDADSGHDFAKDGIKLIEKDGWVYADGTTLGADNGVGIAMGLAAAVEGDVEHPKMELLLTVDEETGLTGANGLEAGFFSGKTLLNLDSEDDSFTVGCAGGEQTEILLPIELADGKCECDCYMLSVGNLRGGHSGVDIHEQRANALKLLGRCLAVLVEAFEIKVADISGGSAHNAIPREGKAKVCISKEEYPKAKELLEKLGEKFKDQYGQTDADICVELKAADAQGCEAVMSKETSRTLAELLVALPYGVYRVSDEFEGVVETSDNVAVIETKKDEGVVSIVTSQRSLKESCLDMITGSITAIGRLAGAKVETEGRYPGWDPDPNSKVLEKCKEIYKEMRGKEPVVIVIHAGLECGIIGKKYAGMDMVSFGPNIENAHSPQERVNIESVDKSWAFFVKLLANL
jgi:dipeptidase D